MTHCASNQARKVSEGRPSAGPVSLWASAASPCAPWWPRGLQSVAARCSTAAMPCCASAMLAASPVWPAPMMRTSITGFAPWTELGQPGARQFRVSRSCARRSSRAASPMRPGRGVRHGGMRAASVDADFGVLDHLEAHLRDPCARSGGTARAFLCARCCPGTQSAGGFLAAPAPGAMPCELVDHGGVGALGCKDAKPDRAVEAHACAGQAAGGNGGTSFTASTGLAVVMPSGPCRSCSAPARSAPGS